MPLVCNNECFYLAGLICPILLARFVICCTFHIRLVLVCLLDSVPSSPWNSILSESLSVEFEINQPPRIWRLRPVKILALSLLTCPYMQEIYKWNFPKYGLFPFEPNCRAAIHSLFDRRGSGHVQGTCHHHFSVQLQWPQSTGKCM